LPRARVGTFRINLAELFTRDGNKEEGKKLGKDILFFIDKYF